MLEGKEVGGKDNPPPQKKTQRGENGRRDGNMEYQWTNPYLCFWLVMKSFQE